MTNPSPTPRPAATKVAKPRLRGNRASRFPLNVGNGIQRWAHSSAAQLGHRRLRKTDPLGKRVLRNAVVIEICAEFFHAPQYE